MKNSIFTMKPTLALIAAVLIIAGCAHANSPLSNEEINSKIEAETFVDIYRQARSISGSEHIVLNDAATKFILRCCESRDSVVLILQSNGFSKIRDVPERFHQKYSEPHDFDRIIVGERGDIGSFGDRYKATIFLRDDRVTRVSASVTKSPPL